MRRWLTSTVLLVVVLVAIPELSSAQEFRNVELNVYIAGSAHTKNQYQLGFPQTITPIAGEFKLDDSLRGGLRFNINTTGHWGEEFFFGFEPNKANFLRKTAVPQKQSYDVRVYTFGMNVMYYLYQDDARKTRPFLSVGIGSTLYQPSAESRQFAADPLRGNLPGFESSAELALNYGIGFKRTLSKKIDFRMDVRGFVSRNPTFGLPRSSSNPSVSVFPAAGAIHNAEASAGLVFKLKK